MVGNYWIAPDSYRTYYILYMIHHRTCGPHWAEKLQYGIVLLGVEAGRHHAATYS